MQTDACRRALEQLPAYLESPDLHRAEGEAAMSHIRACPHCTARVEHLSRALSMNEVDRLTCQECQERLPDYLAAEAHKQAAHPKWHPIALHLATCPHCSTTYAELLDLFELAEGKRGAEPARYPSPRLAFLRSQTTPAQMPKVPWRLDAFGRLVITFSAEFVHAVQKLVQQPGYAAHGLKSEVSAEAYRVALKDAVPDLEVSIAVERIQPDSVGCTIVVEVQIPSRGGWPHLAGTEVTLKRNERELDTQVTDAYGRAVFEGIATDQLAELVLEITPAA